MRQFYQPPLTLKFTKDFIACRIRVTFLSAMTLILVLVVFESTQRTNFLGAILVEAYYHCRKPAYPCFKKTNLF